MKQKPIFLTVLLTALSVFSTEYFVDASRPNDTGAATSWSTAKKTIQAAVDLTADGDTVWVTNGVYDAGGKVTPGYSLTNRVCITKGIAVRSANGRDLTVIKGDSDVRCVFMSNTCSLVGFAITNGHALISGVSTFDCSGGGIWMSQNCSVSNCLVVGNEAVDFGGGVFLFQGGEVSDSTFQNNLVKGRDIVGEYPGGTGVGSDCFGGGVALYEGGKVVNCVVKGNTAQGGDGKGGFAYYDYLSGRIGAGGSGHGGNAHGGGVYILGGGVLGRCYIADNLVHGGSGFGEKGRNGFPNLGQKDGTAGGAAIGGSGFGGGAYINGGTLSSCLFARNAVNGGDATGGDGGNASVMPYYGGDGGDGCGGDGFGGGVYTFDGVINNCTGSKNETIGGLGVGGSGGSGFTIPTFPPSPPTDGINGASEVGNGSGGGVCLVSGELNNSIVWGNSAELFGSDILNFEGICQYLCASDGVESGIDGCSTNAPLFVDAANGIFRLQSNSPCINWGSNAYVTNSTDLDGNPRIVEGTVDMGAYEYQGTIGLADSDSDGISDDWERAHGGNQNPDNTCSNGVNTILQAYIAGLDPNDPDSKFLFSVETGTYFGNILRWQSVPGREYAVYYSTNLVSGFMPLIQHLVPGSGTYIDDVYENDKPRYYKIDVQIDENPGDNVIPPSPLI